MDSQESTRSSADLHHSQGFWTARIAAPHFGVLLTKYLIHSLPNNFSFPSTLRLTVSALLKKGFLLPVDG